MTRGKEGSEASVTSALHGGFKKWPKKRNVIYGRSLDDVLDRSDGKRVDIFNNTLPCQTLGWDLEVARPAF